MCRQDNNLFNTETCPSDFRRALFQIEHSAFHSYGLDAHSSGVLCDDVGRIASKLLTLAVVFGGFVGDPISPVRAAHATDAAFSRADRYESLALASLIVNGFYLFDLLALASGGSAPSVVTLLHHGGGTMVGRRFVELVLGHGGDAELAWCRATLVALLLATGGGPTICLPLFVRKVLKVVCAPTRLRSLVEGAVVTGAAVVGTCYYAVLDVMLYDQLLVIFGSPRVCAAWVMLIVPCQVDCYWRLFRLGVKQLLCPRKAALAPPPPPLEAPPLVSPPPPPPSIPRREGIHALTRPPPPPPPPVVDTKKLQ